MIRRIALAAFFLALSALAPAWSQAVLQAGPTGPGRAPMYTINGGAQALVQDSGPAGGGGTGLGFAEGLYVARGTGTPPYVGQGSGPFGSNWCDYDAPITNATGYHYLCVSPNATGNYGLISFGAGGIASPLDLKFNINGTTYTFPFTTGSVIGPGASTVGDPACWNNTAGTLLKNCQFIAPANGGLGASQATAAANDVPAYAAGGVATPTALTTLLKSVCSSPVLRPGCVSFFGYADPIWWGADSTGVSDSAAAIASAAGASSYVYISPGTYRFATAESISSSPLTIQCAGRAYTTINVAHAARITMSGDHVTIAGCNWVGPGAGVVSNLQLFLFNGNSHIRFIDNSVTNFGPVGATGGSTGIVEFLSGSDIWIERNYMKGNGDFEIEIFNDNVHMSHNVLGGMIASSNTTTRYNWHITDNDFNAGEWSNAQFCFNMVGDHFVYNVNFSGNTCTLLQSLTGGGGGGTGDAYSIGSWAQFSITKNKIITNGFYAATAYELNVMINGTVANNFASSGTTAGGQGFVCEDCEQVTFTGNVVDTWGNSCAGNPCQAYLFFSGLANGPAPGGLPTLRITFTGNVALANAAQTAGEAVLFINSNGSSTTDVYIGDNTFVGSGLGTTNAVHMNPNALTMNSFTLGTNTVRGFSVGNLVDAGATTYCIQTNGGNYATTPVTDTPAASACH